MLAEPDRYVGLPAPTKETTLNLPQVALDSQRLAVGVLLELPTKETPVRPQYRYEEIADDLRKRITDGEFPPGTRLPSRRELTDHYDVSTPVIDRSMQILRILGVIDTLPGVGVYVRKP